MQFHVNDTITNGVHLTDDNIGSWVEWTSVLIDLRTGLHHKTNHLGGYYAGTKMIEDWKYAMFRHGHINGRFMNELGGPIARFTVREN